MALSPIQLFQSNENSLAQILAGGNQTVSGIMDKAIQIGRDISNKQLSQEKDLIQMRQQQTAFDQRRAEEAQKDYENTRQFARGAFESDRNYGLQVKQEERYGVKDMFDMQSERTRTGIAQDELGLSKSRFALEKSEVEREAAAAEAEKQVRRDAISRLVSPSAETTSGSGGLPAPLTKASSGDAYAAETTRGPSATSPGAIARQFATDPSSLLSPQTTATPPVEAPAAAPKMAEEDAIGKVSLIERILKDPDTSDEDVQKLSTERARILKMFPGGDKAMTESERLSGERLEISKNTEKRVEEKREIENLKSRIGQLTLDSESFPKWGGKTPDDLAWDDPNQRPALEITAAEDYESAQAYADAQGKNSGKKPPTHIVKKRKEVWEIAQRLKKLQGAAGGASSSADPWEHIKRVTP